MSQAQLSASRPQERRPPTQHVRAGLHRALTDRVDGEVRFDAGSLGTYSTDSDVANAYVETVMVPEQLPNALDRAVPISR